jgi:tetratricopeptide (TPR) repeat protein
LSGSYNNIGGVYDNMGEYSKALSYYEEALEILKNILPANHPKLAASYNNIGTTCYNMRDYSKALVYYERALDIWQLSLPSKRKCLVDYIKVTMSSDRISSAQIFTIHNKKSFSVSDRRKSHSADCKRIVRRKSFFVTTMNYCFCSN